MGSQSTNKIKALLRLSTHRLDDVRISKIMGWTEVSDLRPELGDWTGFSKDGNVNIIPFFCSDESEAKKFADFVKKKHVALSYSVKEEGDLFWVFWDLEVKGKRFRVCFYKHENYSIALCLSAVSADSFLEGKF